jgi:hypothetical protein
MFKRLPTLTCSLLICLLVSIAACGCGKVSIDKGEQSDISRDSATGEPSPVSVFLSRQTLAKR